METTQKAALVREPLSDAFGVGSARIWRRAGGVGATVLVLSVWSLLFPDTRGVLLCCMAGAVVGGVLSLLLSARLAQSFAFSKHLVFGCLLGISTGLIFGGITASSELNGFGSIRGVIFLTLYITFFTTLAASITATFCTVVALHVPFRLAQALSVLGVILGGMTLYAEFAPPPVYDTFSIEGTKTLSSTENSAAGITSLIVSSLSDAQKRDPHLVLYKQAIWVATADSTLRALNYPPSSVTFHTDADLPRINADSLVRLVEVQVKGTKNCIQIQADSVQTFTYTCKQVPVM